MIDMNEEVELKLTRVELMCVGIILAQSVAAMSRMTGVISEEVPGGMETTEDYAKTLGKVKSAMDPISRTFLETKESELY